MTSFNKRVFEMLIRVQVFAQRYPHLFQEGSVTGRLIQDIDKAVQKFSAEKSSQTSGDEDRKAATEARTSARCELRSQMEAIRRTAQGLDLSGFWLPRDRSDRDQIDSWRSKRRKKPRWRRCGGWIRSSRTCCEGIRRLSGFGNRRVTSNAYSARDASMPVPKPKVRL